MSRIERGLMALSEMALFDTIMKGTSPTPSLNQPEATQRLDPTFRYSIYELFPTTRLIGL